MPGRSPIARPSSASCSSVNGLWTRCPLSRMVKLRGRSRESTGEGPQGRCDGDTGRLARPLVRAQPSGRALPQRHQLTLVPGRRGVTRRA
ncbi:predicted protein [Streptomyces sp. SPB78]|nr:predicted protein [Streptomyces sp. SPB78]